MSSDNFQTQYASFMENMLKSAVAETTKLYETMVDELKEEISRIKKENEDLRTKCSQFENAKSQPAGYHRENQPLRGQSDDSEKCDTAVQCDIVSFRTMLVEQCQPLGQSSLKNQQLLYAGEGIGYGLQEQGGNSQMTLILVKQEESYCDTSLQSAVKQEEVESPVVAEQGFSNESSSLHISLNGTENEGALINQEGTTVETTLAQKDGEIPELPCLGINGSSGGVQSHTSDPEHSIVISLAVMEDNIKEEFEVHQETSEGEIHVPLQCQGDSETLSNEQTVVSAQPYAEEQLAESILINKEVTCEELKINLAEDEATSKTNLSVCHSRGQPEKKMKQTEILGPSSLDVLKDQEGSNTPSVREKGVNALSAVDTVKISSTSQQSSSGQPNETSSVGTSSVQEMAKIALQDMDNRTDGSLPASVLSLSGCSSSGKPKNSETQQLSTGVEKEAIQAPSVEVSSASETLSSPSLKSPQLTHGQHKQRRTSVTLQDAMLLVEAMNQSTLESTSSQRMSPPQTRCAPCVDALQTVDKVPAEPQTLPVKSQFTVETSEAPSEAPIAFVTPKQQHVSSYAATQTIVPPSCHPLTPRNLNINKAKIITVVPRVGSSQNEASLSTEKVSTTKSTAAHISCLTASSVEGLPLKTPSLSCLPQKTDTTSMKSLPDSQLSKPSANEQSGGPQRKKITIIVSRRLAGEEPSKLQSETTVLTAMQKTTATHDVPVTGTSGQSATTSQELSVLSSSETALPKKTENAADNLESPKQTDCVSKISTPTEQPVKIIPTSVLTAVQQTTERRCPAVVKLTKIPVSVNESVLFSSLRLKGVSEGTTQEKSSKPAVSEMPVSSSNISLNLTETPIAVSLNTPQKSDKSNNIQEKAPLTSEASTHSKAPVGVCTQPPAPVTSVEPTPTLDSSEVQQNEASAVLRLTSMAKEDSGPHLQMTQIQFLAQLAVSPIVQEPEKKANTNSLVTRLRRHLKTHIEARRAERNPEGNSKSENTTVSPKKDEVENGSLTNENSTVETSPISPKQTDDHDDRNDDNDRDDDNNDNDRDDDHDISPRMITNAPSVSPVRSGMCNGGDLPEMTDNELTSVTSKATSDSTLMCPTRDSTHGHSVGTEHTKSTSVSPRECNSRKVTASPENTFVSPRRTSGRHGDCPKNKKSMSVSLRRSASGRDGDCPKNKNSMSMSLRKSASGRDGDCPKNKNSMSMSLRKSASGRDGDCPKKKKSISVSPRRSASGRDGDCPKNKKSISVSPRRSASGRHGDCPENKKSMSERPRRSASGRHGDCPENKKSMSESLRRSASGRHGDCPENKKSMSVSLRRSASGRDGDCPENKKSMSESLRRSASGRDGDCPENKKSMSESPRRTASGRDGDCPENKKSMSESPRRSASGRDGDCPENKKSMSVSLRRSASDRDGDCPENKKSMSVSLRRSASDRNGDCPENKKSMSVSLRRSASGRDGDCPENQKSMSVSLRRSASGRDGDCPENKKSMSMSLRRSASSRGEDSNNKKSGSLSSKSPSSIKESGSPKMTKNGASPKNTKSSSMSPERSAREAVSPRTPSLRQSGTRRSSVFNKDDSRTKRVKRESSSSRRSEISSPSVKFPAAAENGISPKRAEKPTPAKKSRLIQDVVSPKKGFKVSIMKLSKAANVKKMANMKKSNKSKLQTTRKNQINCEVVKKCKAKVWIPPVMTESKTPPAEEDESSLPDDASQSKSVPSPIVSPLQPLLVMGRHLLRNQCGECGRILSSTAALENHVSLHTGDRPFLCTFCGKSFPDSKSFKGHDRVHRNGRIHICQHCGKGFVYRFGLTKHIQMVHRRIKPFICQICNKGFFTKRDVEAHIRIHTGEKPFQCTLCERRFKRKVELNVHLRWHNGEKRHWCPYCGKGFLDYNNLKRHKYTHTGEKPHSCPICQKKFTQTAHVKKHVQNVHGSR